MTDQQADAINIPDNQLLEGIKGYSAKDQQSLQWLFSWAGQELGSRQRLCEMLDSDWSTIVRISQGKYPASIASFMRKVRDLQRRVADTGPSTFVETSLTKRIFGILNYALAGDIEGGKLVLITGPSGRGKTSAAREWQRRNNHGHSIYIDPPESGGLRAFLMELSRACRISPGRKTVDLRDRIVRSFHPRRILIIDEVARLLPHGRSARLPTALEFIRRLHDAQHCAIALLATPVFSLELTSGRMRDYFEQLVGRISDPFVIPEKIARQECADIVTSFNKAPAADLVDLAHELADQVGRLRVLFELLRQAAVLAKAKKQPLNRAHLAAAAHRRQKRLTCE
jgi:DNA transposition AAA+ family ATPase